MGTLLISKKGGFSAHIIEMLSPVDDGNLYSVLETKFTSDNYKRAIRNARSYLKRKRVKYKKNPALYILRIKRRRTKNIKRERLYKSWN
jgi:hypothetical protein